MSKGQIIMNDLFIALSLFLVVIVFTVLLFNNYSVHLNEEIETNDMLITAFQISDVLVSNSGYPSKWEENISSTKNIGLATKDRIISKDKLNNFTNLDYDTSRGLLKLYYDFYINLKDLDNNTIASYGYINGEKVVNVKREVFYEGEEAILEFAVSK